MSCTITFTNLLNGQSVPLPYEVSGRIVMPSSPVTQLIAAARQIDDNPLEDMEDDLSAAIGGVGPYDFSFELTSVDCPLPNTYYMLTVYCWDDKSEAVTLASVTFRTVDLAGAPPPPPNGGGPGVLPGPSPNPAPGP